MKLLFIADLHYALKQFDWVMARAAHFDAAIIGGDLLDLGSALDLEVQIVVVEKYLGRLCEQTQVMVSSGNHDCDARSGADEAICKWLRTVRGSKLRVDGDSLEIAGTLFTICPWWDGPESRIELEKLLEEAASRPKKRWIWIHHAPPSQSPICWTGKTFGGDEFLLEWIRRFKPEFVLCGHIHNAPFVTNGSWIDRIGKTWVFNPGKQIGPYPASLSFDFDAMTVEWNSFDSMGRQELNIPVGQFKLPGAAAGGA